MWRRTAALIAFAALVGCAGLEPAGRNSGRAPAATPAPTPAVVSAPAPAPSRVETPAPAPAAPPPVAAPRVEAPAPAAAPARSGENEIVVPGAVERQVPAPAGDPRSLAQRNEDVRAWDQCVTGAQAAYESDPMRPQLDTPEEYCRRSLGMADRMAVPESRRRR